MPQTANTVQNCPRKKAASVNSVGRNLMSYLLFGFLYALSLQPLRLLYFWSDFLYFLVYHILKYRRVVVRKNLRNSFPDKTAAEQMEIERGFYHWFCDWVSETIKMTSISEKEINRRMKFENLEEVYAALEANKSVSLYMGHLCNWEWIVSIPKYLPRKAHVAAIYHPLENATFDRLMLRTRIRFGGEAIPMGGSGQVVAHWHEKGEPSLVAYIADQVPPYKSMHFWPTFLNQRTAVFTGAEKITQSLGAEAYYLDMSRPKRGYYVGKMIKITDHSKDEPEFAITAKYYELLEANILRAPAYWLWSHNRWKRV